MFHGLEEKILSLINVLPLEIFVFVASFIEEVFAPIPSMAVLLATGSFASLQNYTLLALIPLAIIAALGKTIGAIIVYYLSDKFGEIALTKFGGALNVSHEAIKDFGSKITGSTKDYLLLIAFRALPIVPSAVVSIGCGVMKINFKLYLITTFIGTILRDSIFLYIGFKGTQLLASFANHSAGIESLVQTLVLIMVLAGLIYLYLKKRNQQTINN
jgi:membrane protein DedA with SNARE-associated domain